MNIRNPLSKPLDRRWFATWLLLLSVIPLLSIYGRRLQSFSREHLNTDVLAWAIAVPTLLLVLIFLFDQAR